MNAPGIFYYKKRVAVKGEKFFQGALLKNFFLIPLTAKERIDVFRLMEYGDFRAGEGDQMDVLLQSITEQGFPIVVSIYLLVRFEAKLDELTKTIADLKVEISKLAS